MDQLAVPAAGALALLAYELGLVGTRGPTVSTGPRSIARGPKREEPPMTHTGPGSGARPAVVLAPLVLVADTAACSDDDTEDGAARTTAPTTQKTTATHDAIDITAANDETLDVGGHELQWLDTPHVPHGWEAGLLYDATTRTRLCGDLFSLWGQFPPATDELIAATAIADDDSSWMFLAPSSPATLSRLATLDIDTFAPVHGPAYSGAARPLLALADDFKRRIDLATNTG